MSISKEREESEVSIDYFLLNQNSHFFYGKCKLHYNFGMIEAQEDKIKKDKYQNSVEPLSQLKDCFPSSWNLNCVSQFTLRPVTHTITE